jgi:hypothetical protein
VNPHNGLSWSQSLKCSFQFLPGSFAPSVPDPIPATLKQRVLVPTIGQVKPDDRNRDIEATGVQLGPGGKEISDFDDSSPTVTVTRNSDAPCFTYRARLDPEEYRCARKQLKKAVLEHYR